MQQLRQGTTVVGHSSQGRGRHSQGETRTLHHGAIGRGLYSHKYGHADRAFPSDDSNLKRTSFGSPNDWNRLPRGGEPEARRDFVRGFAAAVLEGKANPVPPGEALAVQPGYMWVERVLLPSLDSAKKQ